MGDGDLVALSDRIWGRGNWVVCHQCPPDDSGNPVRHHKDLHEGESWSTTSAASAPARRPAMADRDLAALRAVIEDAATDWTPDAESPTLAHFDALVAEVERLRAAIALHHAGPDQRTLCAECRLRWPCTTARVASAANEKEAHRG